MSIPRVVTFGEIMIRLATPGHLRLTQSDTLEMTFGGGESNVAVSLSHFGCSSAFVTKLPKNDLGNAALNKLRSFGVDTSKIVRGGERMGIYFLESGASQRASKVVYDRAHSSIATVSPSEFKWREILDGAEWFHVTGITPALSDDCSSATIEAVRTAKEMGLNVSCDLNFRKKLWTSEKAGQVMGAVMPYVDYCIANEEDAEKVFGIKAEGTSVTSGKIDHEKYTAVATELQRRFSNLKGIAITLRESYSASHNGWSGLLYQDGQSHFSRRYDIQIVDRVGGGDSFAAGLIYGLLNGKPGQEVIEFAAAASALKHTIKGDFNLATLEEVQTLMAGDGSGRVQR